MNKILEEDIRKYGLEHVKKVDRPFYELVQ